MVERATYNCLIQVQFLVGVHWRSSNKVEYPVLHEDLKGCKFYTISRNGLGKVLVVRCPNSSTTASYMDGKVSRNITVVE